MRISTAERRIQLIEATIVVLKRDGVENASLRTIAREANASLAAVHVCFTNKEELMQAAAKKLLQELVQAVPQSIEESEDVTDTAHRIMDLYWAYMTSDAMYALAQFEIGTWSKRNPFHGDLMKEIYENYEAEIGQLLTFAAKRSGQESTVPMRTLARALVAIMDGCSLQYLGDPSSPHHKHLCDALLDAYLSKVVL